MPKRESSLPELRAHLREDLYGAICHVGKVAYRRCDKIKRARLNAVAVAHSAPVKREGCEFVVFYIFFYVFHAGSPLSSPHAAAAHTIK